MGKSISNIEKTPRMEGSPKILHLACDEKFVDMGLRAFESVLPGSNDLYLYSLDSTTYVESQPKARLSRRSLRRKARFAEQQKDYDLIVIHSLHPDWMRVILRFPPDIPILWLGWGFDYYDLLGESERDLILPITARHLESNRLYRALRNQTAKSFQKLKAFVRRWKNGDKIAAIERIDFFSPVLPSEYALIKRTRNWRKFPGQVIWNYGNLEEDLLKGFLEDWVSGENILLGNSASAFNNHFDAFKILSGLDLSGKSILVPLSYDDRRNKELVLRQGSESFGPNFHPLVDYLPMNKYVELIRSCGFVIMNHVRQQAVGNVVIMLHMGAKIFLREESPVYEFFRNQGAVIFSVQSLEKCPELLSDGLDQAEMENNRRVAIRHWSKQSSLQKTRDLIEMTLGSASRR